MGDEELCAARENVSRAAMQLTATFTTTLKLGAEAATDRMYDLHDWIESDGDSDGADDCELIPVEVAYQAALRHVSRIQKAVAANKARSKLLEEFSATQSLDPWRAVLLVTHADIINQRLQSLRPNELYAPRCCGWMVEDLDSESVLKIVDCDRI